MNKRLLRRVAALEALHDPPPVGLYLLAFNGTLRPEDEALRRAAQADGRPVIIYTLTTQLQDVRDADPLANGPQNAVERPEALAAPEAPPEASTASSASPAPPPHDPWAWARPRREPQREVAVISEWNPFT